MVSNLYITASFVLHVEKAACLARRKQHYLQRNGNIFSEPLDIPEIKLFYEMTERWNEEIKFSTRSKAFSKS